MFKEFFQLYYSLVHLPEGKGDVNSELMTGSPNPAMLIATTVTVKLLGWLIWYSREGFIT